MDGVVDTRVGYTGGSNDNPTYQTVCRGDGHTEALKVTYDPKKISYEEILQEFWSEHRPNERSKVQYRSAIWPTTAEQAETAKKMKAELEAKHGKVATAIEKPKEWHDAEEYHQQYIEKMSGRRW
mmetsp:Transcript_28251/g.92209  ORF Transcript_28251/g.92209 Transcript_28251/m.92209 type:complete len:125 (+) Transcript_28251:191-565(+)